MLVKYNIGIGGGNIKTKKCLTCIHVLQSR